MKLISSMKSGMVRCVKAWRGLLVIWLSSLILVSLTAVPLKNALKTGFGNSMITEKLDKGIDIEAFADMGAGFRNLGAYFISGLILTILTGFIINVFLSGGLFSNLRKSPESYSLPEFFSDSAKNFWSFLVISAFISILILFLFILIFLIPVSVMAQADGIAEGSLFKTVIIAGSVFLLVVAILLLVADYSRAWQAASQESRPFKALGFGLRYTLRTFLLSYPLIMIILLVQFLFGWLVLTILPGIMPRGETGIILLFVLSQSLFLAKLLLKAWRFGTLTSMLELNSNL
jgi:hypothetical protein